MHHKITLIAFSETGARVNLVLKSVFRERQHKLSITTKGHGKGGWSYLPILWEMVLLQ